MSSHLPCFAVVRWVLNVYNDSIPIIPVRRQVTEQSDHREHRSAASRRLLEYLRQYCNWHRPRKVCLHLSESHGNFTGGGSPSPTQLAFNRKNDFCITSSVYILRPEVLESNFYAFRVTGDTKYLNRAAGGITDSSTITWRLQMGLQGSMM